MPDLIYHVIRWTPNLIRDEWINIGVLLLDPASGQHRLRILEEESEFARIRRIHALKDEDTLRNLHSEFEVAIRNYKTELLPWPGKYYERLGNAVQLSQAALLQDADLDVEIERLYHDKVRPVRVAEHAEARLDRRSGIRVRALEAFRRTGLLPKLTRNVRVDEFTFSGDPFRIDFSYKRNGTEGFVQCLALARDSTQAKVLAYTAEAIRKSRTSTEFTAITEREPELRENGRDRFVAGLLQTAKISIVSLERLPVWARGMNALIQ